MKRDNASLIDVAQAAQLALAFAVDLPDVEPLEADLRTQSAILHQMLIMGEAVKRLSPEFRATHANIPWRRIAGMRDVLIHSYDDVDLGLVWLVLERDLPPCAYHDNTPPTSETRFVSIRSFSIQIKAEMAA